MSVSELSDLLHHIGHDLECVTYGTGRDNATVECVTCGMVLYEEQGEPGELYPSSFFLDDSKLYAGYTKLEAWNGAAVPYFDQATIIQICHDYGMSVDMFDDGSLIVFESFDESERVQPDESGLYCLSGWCWYELD